MWYNKLNLPIYIFNECMCHFVMISNHYTVTTYRKIYKRWKGLNINKMKQNYKPNNETIIDKIVAIFTGDKKPSSNTIPKYRINDSAISSVNYETIDNNPIINIINPAPIIQVSIPR